MSNYYPIGINSPIDTIIANQQRLARIQASTLRCGCGGKLKRKSRAGVVTGIECARCGRFAERPQETTDGEAELAGADAGAAVPGAVVGLDVSADCEAGRGVEA